MHPSPTSPRTARFFRRFSGAFTSLALLTVLFSLPARAGSPPAEDRAAILAMAGEFEVLFNFRETVALQEDYVLKKPYQETATEMVVVVEDSPEKIVLQHILLTAGGNRVVKHWKQVWTWEDTRLIEFQGRDQWNVREVSLEEGEGTWSQLVTQTDDSPRYESYGTWKHDAGYSRWESQVTARPLPRREHTKRDDYHILRAVNRHALTPFGWVHEQDNLKQVLDEDGEVAGYIAREHGVNHYDRSDETDFTKAREYWETTREFWGTVSRFWEAVENRRESFAIANEVEGETLMKEMNAIAKAMTDEQKPAPPAGEVEEVIERFLN